jgi:hypothetical protein
MRLKDKYNHVCVLGTSFAKIMQGVLLIDDEQFRLVKRGWCKRVALSGDHG